MALASLLAASLFAPGARTSDQGNAAAARTAAPRLLPGNAGAPAVGTTEPSIGAVRLATRQVEQAVRAQAASLNFSIDQSSGKTLVKVTDSETGQVLRQIPSEEMLSLSQAINSVQGLLLSQRA